LNGAEAWAAGVGVEHLQATFALDHHPDVQAKRTAEHGSNGAGLRRALIHPPAEIVVGSRVLPDPVFTHRAKAR
jgi:hypothetical protein